MTRELKLALIVGFALVLVVTVLISDHLSHARQTKLASLPTEPSKVTEPQPIALEAGADTLPSRLVNEPVASEPQPIDRSMPGTDLEPVIIAQGSGSTLLGSGTMSGNPASGLGGLASQQPAGSSNPGSGQFASNIPSGIDEAIRSNGGRIEGDVIYIPGIQTVQQPIVGGNTGSVPARSDGSARAGRMAAQPESKPLTVVEPKPATVVAVDRVHEVASGDNLYKLCQKYYGDGKVWRKLAKYNGLGDGAQPALKIGQKLKVPSAEALLGRPVVREVATAPLAPVVQTAPGRTAEGAQSGASKTRSYVVKKGDTLAAIAQRELGTVKRTKDILELNKKIIKDADNVPLGVTIQLPA